MSQQIEKRNIRQSAAFAGSTLVSMGLLDVAAHLGTTGLLISGLATYIAWKHGDEIVDRARGFIHSPALQVEEDEQAEQLPAPTSASKHRSLLDRALGRYPEPEYPLADAGNVISADNDIDALFQEQQGEEQATAIPRLALGDIIRHTGRDSGQVCIGRSLTRRGNPPVFINFYGQHLKLIGASQYGKSSMAAAILYLISRTHHPDSVLIALLDMEYKTSKLFADLPHLAEVSVNDEPVLLHARNRGEVLEYLRYIVAVMDERYTLTEQEVEREPILLVYLEEFLALKDYYKRLVDSTQGEARERAKRDYAQLVFYVSEIARRGLKVKVQLLMCAQVDYRDEDFQEALVNITSGMSFCVVATAARAAGFTRTELLNRNVENNQKGQAVVETPDCKDLVLAPEFDLRKKLLAFEKVQQTGRPLLSEQHTSILTARGTGQPDGQRAGTIELDEVSQPKTLEERGIEAWNAGHQSGRRLAAALNIGESAGNQLMNRLIAKGLVVKPARNE